MANIVWSLLYRLPDTSDEKLEQLLEMTRLWARHLRGPGEHGGPIILLTNIPGVRIGGVEMIQVQDKVCDRRAIFALRPVVAYRYLQPAEDDRTMQLDIDSLARHPVAPMFESIGAGEMRVAPSALPLTHPQQIGHLLGRWRRRWYGRVRGWRRHLGVSASLSACIGRDWHHFMGRWSGVIERFRDVALPSPRPGDQGYLNYLYAFNHVPMRRYGGEHIHHLRVNDPTPVDRIERATVLHFPVPGKLDLMARWSRL